MHSRQLFVLFLCLKFLLLAQYCLHENQNIFSQIFIKKNFALPITIFGSNRYIFKFKILAEIHNGNDIYPPVDIKTSILFFLIKKKDFIVKKKIKKKLKGNRKRLFFNFGVFIKYTCAH